MPVPSDAFGAGREHCTIFHLIDRLLRGAIRRTARLPFTFGTSRMRCGPHVTRYTMYRNLARVIQDPSQGEGKIVLSISHSQQLTDVLGLGRAQVVEANYPEHNAVDLRNSAMTNLTTSSAIKFWSTSKEILNECLMKH